MTHYTDTNTEGYTTNDLRRLNAAADVLLLEVDDEQQEKHIKGRILASYDSGRLMVPLSELRAACAQNGDPNDLAQEWANHLEATWTKSGVWNGVCWVGDDDLVRFSNWVLSL